MLNTLLILLLFFNPENWSGLPFAWLIFWNAESIAEFWNITYFVCWQEILSQILTWICYSFYSAKHFQCSVFLLSSTVCPNWHKQYLILCNAKTPSLLALSYSRFFCHFLSFQASGRDRKASVVNNSPYWMQRNTDITVEDYTKQNCCEELHINVIKPSIKIFKGLSKASCKAVNWMNCRKSSRNLWLCLTWSFFFFYEVKHIRDSIYDGFLQFLLNLLIQLAESRIK